MALRIWLPDTPGMLGTVATAIGRIDGNLTGLEVLECQGGVAVDELIVELPGPGLVDGMCAELRLVPGLGIEEVRPLDDGAEEHGLAVLGAAASLVGEFEHGRVHATLVTAVADLFDARWVALVDPVEGDRAGRPRRAPADGLAPGLHRRGQLRPGRRGHRGQWRAGRRPPPFPPGAVPGPSGGLP